MDYALLCGAAFLASWLTLLSGFGLGTLLLPVFALFAPLTIAVVLTAIVHLLNNLVKLALLGRHLDAEVVVRFGVPAIVASFAGAWALAWLSDMAPWMTYELMGRQAQITPVKVTIAMLMAGSTLAELAPAGSGLAFERKYLPLGGVLSGFFGGLSGHQGAFRSAFLVKCGLSTEAFVATGVVIACLVDAARLSVYGTQFAAAVTPERAPMLAAALVSAWLGALIGARLLKRVTMRIIQVLVSIMVMGIAIGLGIGLL